MTPLRSSHAHPTGGPLALIMLAVGARPDAGAITTILGGGGGPHTPPH